MRFEECMLDDAHHSSARLGRMLAALAASAVLAMAPADMSHAVGGRKTPPVDLSDPNRCELTALDKFADTRAAFSQEASGGNMVEAIVDVRQCSFRGKDLGAKVLSGVLTQDADFSDVKAVGIQFARADARRADLRNVDLTDANCYSTDFSGADLRGATFENSILTGAKFGRDPETGAWANLEGTHFEGALLSSSDIGRICENPTLLTETRKYELGCRG